MKTIDLDDFQNYRWILIILFAFLTGFFIVQYLVQTFTMLALVGSFLTLTGLGTVILLVKGFEGRIRLYTIILVLICILIGYVVANALFLSQDEVHYLPEIVRTDGGDGHAAVLYFTHGEPPGYDPMPWILTMKEFDHDNVPFIPWIFRPFFFSAYRNEIIEAGGSPHNELHRTFIDNLKHAMPGAVANGTRFYLAFLDSPPHPEEMAIKAINEGASKIILLPVFTTESTHTIAGQEMVASVHPEDYGVEVVYTGSLGQSESLHDVFVARANEMSIELSKSDVGIILAGHGQPTEWEELYPEQNQQETEYRQAIRDKLIADGFTPENVVLGWMSFQEPTITESAINLGERNVKKILVFSTHLSAKSIHSEIDVPKAVEAAALPADISIEYVGHYADHPLAIRAMVEKILPHL